jgi:type IV pilus assembly protein PilN
MIRINLLGVGEGVQSVSRRRQLYVLYGVLAANVVAGLLLSVLLGRFASSQEAKLAAIKTQLQSVLSVVHDVDQEEHQRALLGEKRRVIAELERRAVGPLEILMTLSEAAPTRLWLNEFTDKGGEVTITGLAIDDPTVAEFLARLQSSPHFHGLELVETAQAEEGQTRVKKFMMRGPLDYSGDGTPAGRQDGSVK